MKRFNFGTMLALAVIACFAVPTIASAEPFIARLNGAEEVPAVSTVATGQFFLNFTTRRSRARMPIASVTLTCWVT